MTKAMKKCPTCNRTYADPTLTFCLADGALLSAPYDAEATQAEPASNDTEPIVSPATPGAAPALPQALATNYAIRRGTAGQGQSVRNAQRWPWIACGIVVVLLASIITASGLYYRSGTSTNNTSGTANANTVATDKGKQGNLLPAPDGYANDFANVIDAKSKNQLEKILGDLKKRRDVEFAVATIKTTGDRSIADYAMTVANQWGVKGAEGGILLLVAIDDRKYQFSTSRQLEDRLTHDLLLQYGGLMTPSFRQGKYGEGILKGVNAVIAKLDEQGKSK